MMVPGTMRAARAALAVIALAAMSSARAADATWDLASAYLANPTANPILSVDAEWHLLRSEGPTGALTPLPNTRSNWGAVEGILAFEGTESCNYHGCFPVVAVNTTGVDQIIPYTGDGLVVPAGAVWIHPANPENGLDGNVAVGFKSQFTGWASVTISLTRIHPGSISWTVDLNGQTLSAPATLDSGTATFSAPQIKLYKGDLLTVRVDANGGYGADSSTLSFQVARVPGP